MKINDSIAINVIFLKLKNLDQDEFLYSYTFYRKVKNDNCPSISAIQFYSLIPESYTDGWGGSGSANEALKFVLDNLPNDIEPAVKGTWKNL